MPARISRIAQEIPLSFRSRRALSDVLRLRGVWHLLRAETALGARVLEGAVAFDPHHPPSLLNLAAARHRQGDVAQAIELLERALVINPNYAKAKENLVRYGEPSSVDAP